MQQDHKIRYCQNCRKFYTCCCTCSSNLLKSKFFISPTVENCLCSLLTLIWKFLYFNNAMTTRSNDFFSKYIYLNSPHRVNTSKLNDPYVYMMTVPSSEQEFEQKDPAAPAGSTSSTISVHSRKSTAGNILANWINKTRKKKKKNDDCSSESSPKKTTNEETNFSEDESDNSSNHTAQSVIKEVPSKSKIPILKINSSKLNFQKLLLLRKFTVKNVGEESGKCKSYVSIVPTEKEENIKRSKSYADMEPLCKCSYPDTNTPIFKLETFDVNAKLALDLHKVISIVSQLKEGEVHIGRLISKFIEDRSFQKELLDEISKHSKLHVTTELQTHNLITEMWMYQNETLKNRENEMQERLTEVVKQNKLLQNNIEHLMSKNEKLRIKSRQFTDCGRPGLDSTLMEVMNKNNDQLRCKINALLEQMEKEEVNFLNMHKKNIALEQQLQSFNFQLQNYKDVVKRMQIENKLEQEVLVFEVQNTQKILKETAEAGDVVLEDLDSLKRQFKTMTCTINWTKFKCRGSSLPDLLYMCRSCINELSKELFHIQNEAALKDKDLNTLKLEAIRYEGEKQQMKKEQNALQEKIDSLTCKETELRSYKVKFEEGEENFRKHKETMQKIVDDYQKEIFSLQESVQSIETLNKELIEKNEELLLIKEEISQYKKENDTVRMQVQGLKQVLSATGTGEVARELAETQEKLVAFQSQYYQILSEKNILIDEIQSMNIEKATLSKYQNSYTEFMQVQQHALDALQKDYLQVKQQLEVAQKQCAVLGVEQSKSKEEKTMLKQIFAQFKSEVNRVHTLEGKMTGMNVEANRLAMIADYNKQLGEKLQSEVAERDVKITELETNMKELNTAQLENAKDKVALCAELNQVCSINERLSTTLELEQQRINKLHISRKEIENAASVQLRVAEKMQKKERLVLLELLKEYKSMVAHRNNLLAKQTENTLEITNLRANVVELKKDGDESQKACRQQIEIIHHLELNFKESKQKLEESLNDVKQLQKINIELKSECLKTAEEMQALEGSTAYLQNTIQQLNKDLNKSRESEMELKIKLQNERQKLTNSETLVEQLQKSVNERKNDNEELTQRSSELNSLYEELLKNYKNDMEINNNNINDLNQALENANTIIEHQTDNIKQLEEQIVEKDKATKELKETCEMYCLRISDVEKALNYATLQSRHIEEIKTQQDLLQLNMDTLRQQYDASVEANRTLTEDYNNLQEQLQEQIDKAKMSCGFYDNYISEMTAKYQEDRKELEQDLETFAIEFEELRSKFDGESKQKNQLTKQQKNLTQQLLTATQMIIDEKLKNQQTSAKLDNTLQEYKLAVEDKLRNDRTAQLLSQEVNDLRITNRDHIFEKKKLHAVVSHLENVRCNLQSDLNSAKLQLEELQQKYSDSQTNYKELKELLQDTEKKLLVSQNVIKVMKEQLDDNHAIVMNLQAENSKLRQDVIAIEFQKSEASLRLHKLQASLTTEQNLNVELAAVNQKIVTGMFKIENLDAAIQCAKYVCDSDSSSANMANNR